MAYYLGIDGGGTKTTCAVGDDDSLIATAEAGASNIVRVGEAEAQRSLHQAIGQACAAAGMSPKQVTRACVGAAGAASAVIVEKIRGIVGEILPGEVLVTGDMQIALEAAFPGAPGIIVIAGTGSIAYGRNALGNTARAGGWGFAVSDEGSAHWIGRNAIAAIFRAYDLAKTRDTMGPELSLFKAAGQGWNVNSIDELVRVANGTPAPNFAALLPNIVACADADDELSRQVLTQAGGELAQLAAVVITKLFPAASRSHVDRSAVFHDHPSSERAQVPLAMVGGVFRHSSLVRKVFYNEVTKLDSRVVLTEQVVDPVQGALRLARIGHAQKSSQRNSS